LFLPKPRPSTINTLEILNFNLEITWATWVLSFQNGLIVNTGSSTNLETTEPYLTQVAKLENHTVCPQKVTP